MATNLSKLRVEKLRFQLSERGLDTSGPKPLLIQRLEEAISEEAIKANSSSITDGGTGKKRPREAENEEDSDAPRKAETLEDLRDMNLRELRQQAALRGVSESGTKKKLLERLSADLQEELEGIAAQEIDRETTEKLVKATKKGDAVLDQWLSDQVKAQYHVLQCGEEIYDAMLNQTNVGGNNNKFYVIQALESDDGGKFLVYNRWGRVGVRGQEKLHGPYTSRDGAIKEFELKFLAKTKNEWCDRKTFVCYPKCYTWLEMDYSDTKNESTALKMLQFFDIVRNNQGAELMKIPAEPRETQLEPRIANFISLICNVSMMQQQMMEIGYNAEKLPLGKLSKSTILKGYDVLKRISDVINQPNRKTLEQLSGEFYTVIPHDFGFKKMSQFVIDTPYKLKCKLQMVEALGEIEVATKLLNEGIDMEEDPLFSHYKHLNCELVPVEANSEEHSMIKTYMQNTHARTHSNYTVDVVHIFRISRHGESERYKKFCCAKNRMLLWHGSRLTNWIGILSQGLRIAPPEAPVTGYMFGKGVYFADMFSKSANYCYSSRSSTAGVLLLCEVALGEMAECVSANYNADQLPEGKLSTKGVGATEPDSSEYKALEDGVVVPLGKPKKQPARQSGLLYNEYIVYNVDQIRMRYVIQVNFNFNR